MGERSIGAVETLIYIMINLFLLMSSQLLHGYGSDNRTDIVPNKVLLHESLLHT